MDAGEGSSLVTGEEELQLAEYELSEVEAQILSLNDRKQLILERIEKLKDNILIKKNQILASRNWANNDFSWSSKVKEILKSVFKLDGFRPLQLETINATLSNEDVILIMPTGGGKSLCYQLPALVKQGVSIVVSPLVSLMEDQLMALKALNVNAAMLSATITKDEVNSIQNDMLNKNGKLKLLYVTPEKLAKSKRFMTKLQKMYGMGRLALIAIDEVHCCSQWGHDFHPDYKFLGVLKAMFPDVPMLGLTATSTSKITIDVQKMLSIQGCLVFRSSFNRPNLYYEVRIKSSNQEECLQELVNLLKTRYKGQSGIIYTTSIKDCEQLMMDLRKKDLRIACYHANLDAELRSKVHNKWLTGEYQAVVATIAFGLGIDKPDVRFVIHHSLSKSMENFYQESGRAGRDNKKAECILMYRLADVFKLSSMVFTQQTGLQNLYNIVAYCIDQLRCRRTIIASHFDEAWDSQDCNAMCDNCRRPCDKKEVNITTYCRSLYQLISNAAGNDTKLTAQKLIDAWYGKGAGNLRVKSIPVPTFPRETGEAVIAHLLVEGYLQEDFHFTPYSTISYLKRGPRAAAAMSDKHNIIMNIGGRSLPAASPSSNDSLRKVVTNNKPSSSHSTEKKSVACRKSTKTLNNSKSKTLNNSSHHKGKQEKHNLGGNSNSDVKSSSNPVSFVRNDDDSSKCKSTVVYVCSDSDDDFQNTTQIPQKRKAAVLDSDSDDFKMWHEARKQERKIRGIMVDYKKRAERRRDFYEKIKADPTQFLQLHGRPVKIHLDPAVAMAGDSPANMMPWQGHQDILIDRFDVRAHLDYIPENPAQAETVPNEELSREDRLANYERYRIIVQNDFLGIGEEKFLHQLYIEEQFGPVTRSNEVDKKKREKGATGAAIPYSYDESSSGQGPATENDEAVEGEEEKEEEEDEDDDDDDSDIDFDLCVDVSQIGPQQAHEMNVYGAAYGMSGNDFYTFLTRDIEEKESLRQAREQEEEKAMYSGRKSRRERRAFREKRLQGRKISPPSYAARTSPTYDPYRKSASKSRSRSRSHSPLNSGQITYITSFGGEEESADEGLRSGLSTSKFLSSSSHSANVVVAPQSKASRSGSPGNKSSSKSRPGRSWENSNLSPHRGHGSRRSSSRWSPNPSHRSRSRDHVSSRGKARSRSPHHSRNRSSSRTRSRHRRSNSSNSSVRSHSPVVKTKARSRSKSPHNQPPPPPVRRYYGSRRGASSSSELEDSDSESTKQSSSPVPHNSKPLPHKTLSSGFGNSGAGTKSQPKLTPQERLKKKMQALLNRQYKADKRAERIRHEKQEQERQDREDELREMAIKLRRRERERRHRMQDDEEEYEEEERESSPSSQSYSNSPSPSPPPDPASSRSGTSGHRRNRWDHVDETESRDRRSRRGHSSDRQDQHKRSRSRSPHQKPKHRPLVDY